MITVYSTYSTYKGETKCLTIIPPVLKVGKAHSHFQLLKLSPQFLDMDVWILPRLEKHLGW